MRNTKILDPNEPLVDAQGRVVRRTWWYWLRNMFGDVADAQALAFISAQPSSRGIEQKISALEQTFYALAPAQGRVATLEKALSDLTNLVNSLYQHSPNDDVPQQLIGTWTPADNSGAALVFTSVSAGFTKIGNMVFAYGTLTYPATVDGTAASIKGLPYTVANANYAAVPCLVDTTATIAGGLILVAAKNAKTAAFDVGSPVGAVTNVTLSGATVTFNLVYPVE